MALLEDTILEGVFKGGLGTGLAVGIGALILGPVVLPLAGGLLRPVAKAVIKTGMIVFDQGRHLLAEAQESVGDLVAESKVERSGSGLRAEPSTPVAGEHASRATRVASLSASETGAEKELSSEHERKERPQPWIVRGY